MGLYRSILLPPTNLVGAHGFPEPFSENPSQEHIEDTPLTFKTSKRNHSRNPRRDPRKKKSLREPAETLSEGNCLRFFFWQPTDFLEGRRFFSRRRPEPVDFPETQGFPHSQQCSCSLKVCRNQRLCLTESVGFYWFPGTNVSPEIHGVV